MAETRHRAHGGASRQGRGKRRRRTEAGLEPRDEGTPSAAASAVAGEVSGKWIPGAGSVGGATNPMEVWTYRRASQSLEGQPCGQQERARSSRVSARPGVAIKPGRQLTGCPVAGKRQGPRRKARRAKAEPGSRTNGYSGWSDAEGQCNTAEGLGVAAPESQGQRTSVQRQGHPGRRTLSARDWILRRGKRVLVSNQGKVSTFPIFCSGHLLPPRSPTRTPDLAKRALARTRLHG